MGVRIFLSSNSGNKEVIERIMFMFEYNVPL